MSKTKEYARTLKGGGAFTKEDIEMLYQNPSVANSYDQERFQSYAGRLKGRLEGYAVCAFIAQEKHDSILDLATGTGRFAVEMKRRFPNANVIGIDQSAAMLKEARAKSSGPQFIEMDSFNTEFEDGFFNVVTAVLFIRHFGYANRRKAYAEIRRLLSPDGALLMDVANRAYHENLIKDRPVYDEIYTKEEFHREMAENGFRVERFFGIPVRARGLGRILSLRKDMEARFLLECSLNKMLWGFGFFTRRSPNWIVRCRKIF